MEIYEQPITGTISHASRAIDKASRRSSSSTSGPADHAFNVFDFASERVGLTVNVFVLGKSVRVRAGNDFHAAVLAGAAVDGEPYGDDAVELMRPGPLTLDISSVQSMFVGFYCSIKLYEVKIFTLKMAIGTDELQLHFAELQRQKYENVCSSSILPNYSIIFSGITLKSVLQLGKIDLNPLLFQSGIRNSEKSNYSGARTNYPQSSRRRFQA